MVDLVGSAPEVVALLKGVTYKPGYEVGVFAVTEWGVAAYIAAYVPDVTAERNPRTGDPVRLIRVRTTFTVPFDLDAAKGMIYGAFLAFERHECEEWLRFGGEQYVDPHERDGHESA